MKEFEEKRAPRPLKRGLSLGAMLFFVGGVFTGVFYGSVSLGVLLFALGAVLFALRGYLNTGDRAVAGVLIFVAVTAVGTQVILYFLGP
jgi:hypothetical protein